jgi:hypothetical protein
MGTNTKALDKSYGILKGLMEKQFMDILTRAAYGLLVHAETSKEFHNLTGNTLTSYMVGIYSEGTLKRVVAMNEADAVEPPTRKKLSRGNGRGTIYVEDYDSGRFIHVAKYKLMPTDEDYGYNTSKMFLSGYKPQTTKGFGIVMCTGTEYSEYLEAARSLNVLTETFYISPRVILQNLKPIK